MKKLLLLLLIVGCSSIGGKIGVIGGQYGAKLGMRAAEQGMRIAEEALQNELLKNILSEMDSTVKHSDELPNKLKENTDNFVNKVYNEINNGLIPFINPESFIVEVQLSVEHTAWYDSSFLSIEYEFNDVDKTITFKINEKGKFNFSTTRDSLVTLFDNSGLVYSDWYFLDEDLILFVALNPTINIYIDDELDLDKFSSSLIFLINEILNSIGRGRDVEDKPINFHAFEDRINFISKDISKHNRQQTKPKSMTLNRDEIYDESWAVIIGIDEYQNISNLDYAVNDAESVKKMLINQFSYEEKNVKLLINEDANRDNIEQAISDVSLKADKNDRILVFFAGHGETMSLPDGGEMGYLLPVDGKQENLYASAIPMNDLKDLSNMSKAKHMLFLVDACYGGLAAVGTRGLELAKTPKYLEKITNIKARQIITAGGSDEKVIEKSEWGHSAYTKNLLRALKDGLADTNGDGYITAGELGLYLNETVTIDSENQQTPQSRRLTSHEGEFIFFNSP